MLAKYVVIHKVNSPYHAQTISRVELSTKELKRFFEKTDSLSCTDWSLKLNDALWPYWTTFKTSIDTSPFPLVFRNACLLPLQLEYKSYWATKFLNFDFKAANEERLLLVNEMDEFWLGAYENS